MSDEFVSENSKNKDSFDIKSRETSSFNIFGRKVDRVSTIIFSSAIIIWTLLWIFLGLFKLSINKKSLFIIYLFIVIIFLYDIYKSEPKVANAEVEMDIIFAAEEMNLVVIGTIILFTVFAGKIKLPYDINTTKILFAAILVMAIAILYYGGTKKGEYLRILRKYKQCMYNIAIGLFCVFLLNLIV